MYVLNTSYGQVSKIVSFNSAIGVYQTKVYELTRPNGNKYLTESTDYKRFFDQHGLNSKYGLGFEWKWNWLSINLGVYYSRSYNNYAYEHRYKTDNLYGKYKVKEKFTALTFDPLVKIRVFKTEKFRLNGVVGMEMENVINYIQTERSINIGIVENGKYTAMSNTMNKNRIVANGYTLILRPFAGISGTFDVSDRLILEVRPIVADILSGNPNYILDFEPYSGGTYRNAQLNYSLVLSLGYKL